MPLRQRGTGRRQSSEVLAAKSGKAQEGENSMEKGRLCLCATPIGNLEDISLRVLRCLREADLIAAEDTRNSARLLAHFGIRTPMTSYHEFNKYDKAKLLLQELLKGKSIALITDAGMPCISDPGEELVREAAMAGISVTSLPGPSAALTALSLSGLPSGRFSFEGFLPRDKKERQERLREIAEEPRTLILYEAPHRLRKTLSELCTALGEKRRISLCRELTKLHEEILRTDLSEALLRYESEDPRGEYVLVIEGKPRRELLQEAASRWESLSLEEHLSLYMKEGLSEKEAMKKAARDRGIGKREIYRALKGDGQGKEKSSP